MKRELKFKVFWKKTKKIYDVKEIDFATKLVAFTDYEADWHHIPFDEVELLQYTGLCGREKKEIYEDMLVRIHHEDFESIYICFWDSCNYEFGFQNEERDFGIVYVNQKDIKVIGFIQEHPELKGKVRKK